MFDKSALVRIGSIGVDAGIIWVGDPCYLTGDHNPPSPHADWGKFCDIISDKVVTELPQGLCIQTLHGDGQYEVYGVPDKDMKGKFSGIYIDFAQILLDDDDDEFDDDLEFDEEYDEDDDAVF